MKIYDEASSVPPVVRTIDEPSEMTPEMWAQWRNIKDYIEADHLQGKLSLALGIDFAKPGSDITVVQGRCECGQWLSIELKSGERAVACPGCDGTIKALP